MNKLACAVAILAVSGASLALPPTQKATFPGAPATAAGEQLTWLFDGMLARHAKFTQAELDAHFHPAFLAKVPAAQLLAVLGQLGGEVKELVIKDVRSAGDEQLAARVAFDGTPLLVKLHLDAATKQIDGLLFQPAEQPGPKPTSMAEAQKMLTTIAPRAQLLVASLDHGMCKPLHEVSSREELAIGSTFKLYVLLGLADRILAGKLAWDGQVTVRDDWKSLPSGITQNDPAGTKLSITTLAERMISISDNTAADHLLYTVGRAQVEGALLETKHQEPALDTPFLSTRELFLFKVGLPAAEVEQYLKESPTERRAFLDKTLAGRKPDLENATEWTTARNIGKLEWFASADDLCRAMGTLWQRAQDPKAAPLLAVLSKNPGLPIDHKVWPYIGFKGGSEPGVVNLTYLLRRDDDRWFVVTMGFNSAEGGTIDEGKVFSIAQGVIELLGAERPAQ